MRSHTRMYWRRPRYWRWWWRESVGGHTKGGLAALLAIVFAILGYVSAERLTATSEGAALTTERVVTVVRRAGGSAALSEASGSRRPSESVTVLQTITAPGETNVMTVRRDGERVVVRAPGETVMRAVTLPGTVRERVVTEPRTETITQTETLPARTVTETTERTVTDEVTVTEEVTITDEVTVTVTVTVPEVVVR